MHEFSIARNRMVNEQLGEAGITDSRVLQAMRDVPRHLFVPASLRHRAYHGCALPIGYDQTISQPFIVGLMSALLELNGTQHVLEVGTGSGYQAAILSLLAKSVVTVERVEPLALRAAALLEKSGYSNIEVYADDGHHGRPDRGLFDAIVVTACANQLPTDLFAQLHEGGKMVIPIGQDDDQVLYRYQKVAGEARIERSADCRFVPMLNGITRGGTNA